MKPERGYLIEYSTLDSREDRNEYAQLLQLADILPVTSRQDFFGGSTVEAIYCDCYPLLPRRLAFPEHIPPHAHHLHLYDDEHDLYQKLKQLILDIRAVRERFHHNDFVARYDWRNLASIYDQTFTNLKNTTLS